MSDLRELLERARTIAVVGCSPRVSRTSHRIAKYLQDVGYRVIPINPHADEILGERCYRDLASIPANAELDIVNVFRRSPFTADAVDDAVRRLDKTGQRPAIWTQLGVSSPEAERRAAEAGFAYVRNRCIMVERERLLG